MQVTRQVYAPGLIQTRHAHAVTTCSMVLAGTLRESVGGQEVIARPLSIVLKPADTEHTDEFGTAPVHLIRITLSEADTRAVGDVLPVARQWRWTVGGAASRAFLGLLRDGCRDAAGLGPAAERLVWDALAALASSAEEQRRSPPEWLNRVRQELDDATSPARLSDLAAKAGVHPVYLARQFRRFFGRSVSGYIHQSRVQRAAELITRRPSSLGRTSAEAGFSDQPHLCRVFRRETGITPAGFRALVGEVRTVQDSVWDGS